MCGLAVANVVVEGIKDAVVHAEVLGISIILAGWYKRVGVSAGNGVSPLDSESEEDAVHSLFIDLGSLEGTLQNNDFILLLLDDIFRQL